MKMNECANTFGLLGKTRAELTGMLPQTNKASGAEGNPAVNAVTQAMADLDAIKLEKEATMNEAVAKLETLNCVEDLMSAH